VIKKEEVFIIQLYYWKNKTLSFRYRSDEYLLMHNPEKVVMKKLFIINILLIVSLFYTGAHLNEEEKAFLAGLREGRDSYAWASFFYLMWAVLCTGFSTFVGFKLFKEVQFFGGVLLALSIGAFFYAVLMLSQTEPATMQEVLRVFVFYIILGMWLNLYALLSGKITTVNSEIKGFA